MPVRLSRLPTRRSLDPVACSPKEVGRADHITAHGREGLAVADPATKYVGHRRSAAKCSSCCWTRRCCCCLPANRRRSRCRGCCQDPLPTHFCDHLAIPQALHLPQRVAAIDCGTLLEKAGERLDQRRSAKIPVMSPRRYQQYESCWIATTWRHH